MFTDNFNIFGKSYLEEDADLRGVFLDQTPFEKCPSFRDFEIEEVFNRNFEDGNRNEVYQINSTPYHDDFVLDFPTLNSTNGFNRSCSIGYIAKLKPDDDALIESTSVLAEFGEDSENKDQPQSAPLEKKEKEEIKKKRKSKKTPNAPKDISNRERFCKEHDREMFVKLNNLCDQSGIEISGFWTNKTLDNTYQSVLETLAEQINWDYYKIRNLLTRIRKLGKNSTKFSARDVKLLRKLINQQKRNNYIDYSAVVYYFPGKSIKTLEAKYNEKYSHHKADIMC